MHEKVNKTLSLVEAGARNAAGANAVGQSDIQEMVKAVENRKRCLLLVLYQFKSDVGEIKFILFLKQTTFLNELQRLETCLKLEHVLLAMVKGSVELREALPSASIENVTTMCGIETAIKNCLVMQAAADVNHHTRCSQVEMTQPPRKALS